MECDIYATGSGFLMINLQRLSFSGSRDIISYPLSNTDLGTFSKGSPPDSRISATSPGFIRSINNFVLTKVIGHTYGVISRQWSLMEIYLYFYAIWVCYKYLIYVGIFYKAINVVYCQSIKMFLVFTKIVSTKSNVVNRA